MPYPASLLRPIVTLLLSLGLAACGPRPAPAATQPLTVVQTTAPPDTPLPSASATRTVTSTASATPTASPTASATRTQPPTATATITRTPQPRATATPAPPTPTATAARPAAHVFADTPIWEFDASVFIQDLEEAHRSFQTMTQVVGVAATSGTGSCHSFSLFSAPWTSLHGFSNVPDLWWPLYYEYRSLLFQAYAVTEPIRSACAGGGGAITPEASQAMTAFFDPAQNRLFAMIAEAQALR